MNDSGPKSYISMHVVLFKNKNANDSFLIVRVMICK